MDMEVAGGAVRTLPKLLCWKLRWGRRFTAPWIQSLGPRSRVRLGEQGALSLGKETVSRGSLMLRAEGGKLTVGDKCFFNANCSVTCLEQVHIGNRCQFANNLVIVDHDHDYRKGWGHYRTAPVVIGNDVWVGANCVILKGARIGDGCVIGAGSVVSGTLAPGTVFYQRRERCSRGVSAERKVSANEERTEE